MASQEQEKQSEVPKAPDCIRFHYIKANYFRVVHADGVYGGINPRGLIQMNFYSERNPIPQVTAHHITVEGRLGDEIPEERVSRDGLIREIEVGAVIDVETAKWLVAWLNDKIAIVENLQQSAMKKE